MNFLEDILNRLSEAPARVALEELRPSGRVTATAGELLARIAVAREFLTAEGLKRGDRCAVVAGNSSLWAAIDLAAMSEGIIVVPLYARQAPGELAAMMRDCQPGLVCCGDEALREALRAVWPEAPRLVILDEVFARQDPNAPMPPPVKLADGDAVTIIYTSGTSGEAKGVILNAGNVTYMLSCITAQLDLLMVQAGRQTGQPDRVYHYLPFCFAGSWLLLLTCLERGSRLRLTTDLTRIASDLTEAAPDYCQNVPTLLERMRTAIEGQINSRGGIISKIFWKGKAAWMAQRTEKSSGKSAGLGGAVSLALARRLIFPNIREKLGPNLKALICGSAPLAVETQLFFMMLGIPVLQAYGLTETTGICTMDTPGQVEPGAVGSAISGSEMKLGEGGEILVRGPHIFPGYWNRPRETADALAGGWFHTGDQGELSAAGHWRITGRLKNLLVLNSGHNVAPEPLEERLMQVIPGAQNVVVFGHARSYLVALVIGATDRSRIAIEIGKLNETLPHYRQIRGWLVEEQPLTIDSGLLTANGKLRRGAIAAHFGAAIDALYAGRSDVVPAVASEAQSDAKSASRSA